MKEFTFKDYIRRKMEKLDKQVTNNLTWFVCAFGILALQLVLLGEITPEEQAAATDLTWIIVGLNIIAVFTFTLKTAMEFISSYSTYRQYKEFFKMLK